MIKKLIQNLKKRTKIFWGNSGKERLSISQLKPLGVIFLTALNLNITKILEKIIRYIHVLYTQKKMLFYKYLNMVAEALKAEIYLLRLVHVSFVQRKPIN